MKKIKIIIASIVFVFFLFSCQNKSEGAANYEPVVETREEINAESSITEDISILNNDDLKEKKIANQEIISSTAATYTSDERKLIRTADIRFQVSDVYRSTINIEKVVMAQGGFVTESHLNTEIHQTKTQKKKDSIIEWRQFSRVNELRFRVPSDKLHQTLLEVANEIDYLNYRIIQAQDVTLDVLREELDQKRASSTASQLDRTAQRSTNDLNAQVNAIQSSHNYKTQKDRAYLENLQLQDKVAFSTVTLYLQGEREMVKETYLNPNVFIENNGPHFGEKAVEALAFGWRMIQQLLLALLHIWPLLLVVLGLIFLVYRIRK